MADSQDRQKANADAKGRGCIDSYEVGDQVLLNDKSLRKNIVSAVFKTTLRSRFMEPLKVVAKEGLEFTIKIPLKLRTHPVFYVGLLNPFRDPTHINSESLAPYVVQVSGPERCIFVLMAC